MSAVSYYDCQIDNGREQEHSYMDAPYCPWCRIAELEAEVDKLKRGMQETVFNAIQRNERPMIKENARLRKALKAIAKEEDTLGWVYAARIAKAAIKESE